MAKSLQLFFFIAVSILSLKAFTQTLLDNTQNALQIQIAVESASLFAEPDIDSQVIDYVPFGKVISAQKVKNSDFYKIKGSDGEVAYLYSDEVKIYRKNILDRSEKYHFSDEVKVKQEHNKSTTISKRKKIRPFESQRYVGLVFENQNYKEVTLGASRSEDTAFFGVKFSGFNTLVSGEVYTDTLFLINNKPPSWYQKISEQQVNGFILNSHFLVLNTFPRTSDSMTFWGFGPMLNFSHYDIQALNKSAQKVNYSMDDLNLGVVFNLGVALRLLDEYSIRIDGKYYWQKTQYFSLGMTASRNF